MKVYILLLSFAVNVISAFGQDTIRLKKYAGNLKQIEVFIEGQAYNFLFDTGGGETFISTEIAQRLGKLIYGKATTFRMSGERITYRKCNGITLRAGALNLFHPAVGVWDIMNILPAELPKLDGVFSLKSFHNRIVSLNLAQNLLIVETPKSARKKRKEMEKLDARYATGLDGNESTFFINVPLNKQDYWFLFDSGNLNDLLLSLNTAFEWKILNDTVSQRKELGLIKLQFGKNVVEAKAAATSIIYDGALNYDLLRNYIFMIDLVRKEIWIRKYPL